MSENSPQLKNSTVRWIHQKFREKYGESVTVPGRNALDELVFNLLSLGCSKARAEAAFDALKEEYFDWNEVRVTIPASIAETVKGVGSETQKATRLVKILQGIFEDRSEVDLEFLTEMAVPAIRNYLGGMEGIGDNTVDTVLVFSLGIHTFPMTRGATRFSERFGLLKSASKTKESRDLREQIEAEVEQGAMAEFVVLLEFHTDSICKSDKPLCPSCPLNRKCLFGKSVKTKSKPAK